MLIGSERFAELFCAVVEAGSFSGAASALGLTPAAVSRAVSKHEQRFGVQLFRRTTRSMRLSEAGELYFEHCRQALTVLEVAESALTQRQLSPRGKVRLSVPTTYGHYRVLPLLADFLEQYPTVSLDVHVGNRNVDFVAEGFDLAVRAGELSDSTLIVRKLEDAPLGLYASAAYLERYGVPKRPEDLERHRLLGFVRPSTGRTLSFLLQAPDGTPFEIRPSDELRCSDDFLGVVTLARAGAGIAQAFQFITENEVRAGNLVEVLPRYAGRSRPFSLLMPARGEPSLAVRLLSETLLEGARRGPAQKTPRKTSRKPSSSSSLP
jgi:DNA-binding transcriptional LysR family regulator